jgi:hypothetical protein
MAFCILSSIKPTLLLMSPNHQASRADVQNPTFATRVVAGMQFKPF